jgi:hypothetical protein
MHPWLRGYNAQRPHSAFNGKTPISRINENTLIGNDG